MTKGVQARLSLAEMLDTFLFFLSMTFSLELCASGGTSHSWF